MKTFTLKLDLEQIQALVDALSPTEPTQLNSSLYVQLNALVMLEEADDDEARNCSDDGDYT